MTTELWWEGFIMRTCLLIVILILLLPAPALMAQTPQAADVNAIRAQIDALRADYDKKIQDLQKQLEDLQAQLNRTPPPPPEQVVPAGVTGGSVSASKVFNPDISVIGDFLGAAGSNKVQPEPSMEMHETEVAFQATVDPYAKADFFLSFGEEGVTLEEGYITFPAIPGGILLKVGKKRAAFGKVNTLHNHVLPWTDRPIVTKNLVGGEDGIDSAGFSVARLIPNPFFFLEATGEVFRGDSGVNLFRSSERSQLIYVANLRGYQDITNNTNLDLGVSFARGHNDSGTSVGTTGDPFTTRLFDANATVRWKPLQRAVYHSFVGRSEYVWSKREQPGGTQNSAGYYGSIEYQLARRWFTGFRYDHSGQAENADLVDKGQSAILSYSPSEFSLIRGQYRRTNYADGPTANEFLFQVQFAIGAHGAHPF